MGKRVDVAPVVMSCAVRYALSCNSYLPGLVSDEVRRVWPHLGEQQSVIRDDLLRWLSDPLRDDSTDLNEGVWGLLLAWIDNHTDSEPMRPDRCPTCGSDDRDVRGLASRSDYPLLSTAIACDDPWHSRGPEQKRS